MTVHRIADAPDVAQKLASSGISRQSRSPWLSGALPDPDVAARTVLQRYLDADPLVSGWVAIEDGRAVALLGAALEIVTEDHFGYTFMPPRHASTPLAAWTAASGASPATVFPSLIEAVARDARAHGIERLLVQTRPHDWIGGAFWRSAGMRPDAVLAGLPLGVARRDDRRGRRVRRATSADERFLIRLAFDSYDYHARFTRTGSLADQSPEPTRRGIVQAFSDQAAGTGEILIADGADGAPAGSVRASILELPENSPGRAYLPPRYGYIGLTSVAPHARGTGLGTALVDAALDWFEAQGLDYVFLHYVDDNSLSRPFWNSRGFSPIVVTLAGDILR